MNNVTDYLNSHDIKYTLHKHPAVFTCEDSEIHCKNIPGVHSKNLFLRNKKGTQYYLVVIPSTKRLDIKALTKKLELSKLSFGSPERLKEKLDLLPGSVSPFGLINNPQGDIKVVIDEEVYNAPIAGFHPNDNTATIEITKEMFHKYLKTLPHQIEIIDL